MRGNGGGFRGLSFLLAGMKGACSTDCRELRGLASATGDLYISLVLLANTVCIYGALMPLHIRDDRADKLARRLAKRRGTTMTRAVIEALEGALAREERPLRERVAEIAADLERAGNRARGHTPTKQEIDELWGNE